MNDLIARLLAELRRAACEDGSAIDAPSDAAFIEVLRWLPCGGTVSGASDVKMRLFYLLIAEALE